MECGDCHSEEEQLSPVSVMDFPSEDEDEDGGGDDDKTTVSSQFRRVLDTVERTRQELVQNLDLEPIDLESRFESVAYSDEEEEEEDRDAAWELLCQLMVMGRIGLEDLPRSNEKLLLGFFDEELHSLEKPNVQWRKRLARADRCMEGVEEDLMASAREWIGGINGCVRREEMGGVEQVMKEMERGGGWMCLEEGEEEVEAGVLGWLVGELVLDLVCHDQ